MVSVDTQMLRVEEGDDFFVVGLNRPEKLNAIDTELMGELYEFWTDVDANPRKGVLLTGRGESTCAGADIDVLGSDEMDSFSEKEHEVFDVIRRYPLPTVMACKGAAVGMGFILALECDLAILGEDTTLSYPEFSMGLYSNLGVELLAHHVSVQFAKEVVPTGEPVSPERARGHGIAAYLMSTTAHHAYNGEVIQRNGNQSYVGHPNGMIYEVLDVDGDRIAEPEADDVLR